jgi:hypothetical protein
MGDLLQTANENLRLPHECLQNNMSPTLYEKCLESEELFPVEQQGGPLLYSILQTKLESSTEMAAKHLLSKVEALDIKNYDGENIPKIVSHIHAAMHRICMQNAAEYDKTLKRSITVQYPDPDQILEAAENKYVQLTSLQQWDGVTTNY